MSEGTKTKKEEVKIVNFEEINEEKVLFEWDAPERPFQKKDRDFWITVVAILFLVGMILFLIKEIYLVVALVSVMFLYYVLSTVPPAMVKNQITNKGVYFGEKRFDWNMLERFWLGKSMSNDMVFFETIFRFPTQIALVINPQDADTIKKIAVKRIPMLAYSPTFQDRLIKWFKEKLPLENKPEERSSEIRRQSNP